MSILPGVRLTFIQLPRFAAKWSSLGLGDGDLVALESALLANPTAGPAMAGTGGVRKLRFAPPSRHTGKSGAFRVGYAYVAVADVVYLLALFGKNDQANFTAAQKAELRTLMRQLDALHRPA